MTARYNPSSTPQWTFTYNDYDTLMGECLAGPSTSDDKCLSFGVNGQPLRGSVDPSTGTITVTVPATFASGKPLLRALAGGQGDGQRPHLVPAATGSRFYDASTFSFGDASASDTEPGTPQTYLYTLDNTPSMDFLSPLTRAGSCGGAGHQPRARHSGRCGRSAPRVVSLPWPG